MNKDDIKSFHMKDAACPNCGTVLDAATSFTGDKPPKAGSSVSVCCVCSNWNVFIDDHQMRSMTEKEIMSLSQETFQKLVLLSKFVQFMKDKDAEESLTKK